MRFSSVLSDGGELLAFSSSRLEIIFLKSFLLREAKIYSLVLPAYTIRLDGGDT